MCPISLIFTIFPFYNVKNRGMIFAMLGLTGVSCVLPLGWIYVCYRKFTDFIVWRDGVLTVGNQHG